MKMFENVRFFLMLVCFWLCWVFVAVQAFQVEVQGLLIVVAFLVAKTSVVVTHGLSCSTACGQGLNPCLLHWQEDSLPLRHQRSLKM